MDMLKLAMSSREITLLLESVKFDSMKRLNAYNFQNIDYEHLLLLASQHGVLPQLYNYFMYAAHVHIPEFFILKLKKYFLYNISRNHCLAEELIKIYDNFAEENIQIFTFKGPTLAILAYGSLSLRQIGDIDIMVDQKDIGQAKSILETSGFFPHYWGVTRPLRELTKLQELSHYKNYNEWTLRRDDGMQIDLHWHTAPRIFPFRLDPKWLMEGPQDVILRERSIPTFAIEKLILYLCMHAAKEQRWKISMVVDIDNIIRKNEDINWNILLQSARKYHAERVLSFWLRLAHELLGTPISDEIDLVNRPNKIYKFNYLFKAYPLDQKRDLSACTPIKRITLDLCEGFMDKLSYFSRAMFISKPHIWARIPLPDTLFPLYAFITPLTIIVRCIMTVSRKIST